MAKTKQSKTTKKIAHHLLIKQKLIARKRELVMVLVVLVTILGGYLFLPQFKPAHLLASKPSPVAKINFLNTSTTSISAKPTTTPHPIPTNFGRSVKVPIIYYHYIGKNPNPADKLRDNLSVDPELFDQQMGYIASNGFTPITFDTLYAGLKGNTTLPAKPIIITFDDGYVDFYVNAFPILRKYNLHVTQFIPTGLIDTAYYLHWEQIKEMDKTGLISFEAHTVAHANLPTLNEDEIRNQLVASKKTLEEELGKPVNFMAYPFGTSNEKVWQATKDAGYFGAAGTWGGDTESEGTLYDMPRIKIPGGISLEEFEKKI